MNQLYGFEPVIFFLFQEGVVLKVVDDATVNSSTTNADADATMFAIEIRFLEHCDSLLVMIILLS